MDLELMDAYLTNQITRFRLWIADTNKQVKEMNCETLILKPHPTYMGYQQGVIQIEKWVWESVERDAPKWRERLIMLLTEDGYQNVRAYKIVSHEIVNAMPPAEKLFFQFVCKEDRGDE
ncbi:hypothetical protein SAMN02799624_05374 [Paenibacillus sp. UNC496MF]|uniref:hypothetical protein n=1 Tax=Paenibacillus sp. UNC496MF TaxID=1502753 RepID=UPI0008EEAFC1|nr:hypothetical protein [Paenibacillus sp. UNC496MF]SFJ64971.1 hypothetical protein SAMN02799624_05374 [Paenibacillus sp. UNC496MF]